LRPRAAPALLRGRARPELDSALKALIGAAEAGRPEDVAFAEQQVRRFFEVRALL